jgi:integrase
MFYVWKKRYADALPFVRAAAQMGFLQKSAYLAILKGALENSLIKNADALNEGYQVVQRATSTIASKSVNQLAVRVAAGNDQLAQIVRRAQDLSVESERFDRLIIEAASKEPSERDAASEQQIRDRILAIARERLQIGSSLSQEFPDYAALAKPGPLSVQETQQLLADDEALIVFDFDQRSYVWVFTRSNAVTFELPITEDGLEAQVRNLRVSLGKDAPQFDLRASYALYQAIFAPFAEYIASKKRVSIVTNGALSSLPLQLLITSDPAGKKVNDVDWLIRKYAITVLPSTASFKILRGSKIASYLAKPMIGFGDPVFNRTEHNAAKQKITSLNRTLPDFYRGVIVDIKSLGEALTPLPETAEELRAVADSLGAKRECGNCFPCRCLTLGDSLKQADNISLARGEWKPLEAWGVSHVLPRLNGVGTMRLTVKTADGLRLPPGKTDHIEFDDDIPGFGLRLRDGGSRTWIYQYRIGSKQRRMVLGSAKSVPLALARDNAGKLAAKVALGGDPAMDKQTARRDADNTFGALVDRYLEARQSEWRPRSEVEIRRHLTGRAKTLHRLPISAVSQKGVANLLTDVAREAGNVTSNRVRASLCAFLGWVMREGIRLPDGNVASYTNKREERSRDRVLNDAELKTVWYACLDDDYGAVLKVLMLTGQRASEIAELRWNEVHDDQIVLPAERTKNGRAHIVPLGKAAKAIMTAFSGNGRTYVFGRDDTGFQGWSKAKEKIDARIIEVGGKVAHWTPHDLRRTVATRMVELGVQPHVVEAVLNHASGHKSGVAGIYNRATYDREKREALNLWAEHLLAVIVGRNAVAAPLKLA